MDTRQQQIRQWIESDLGYKNYTLEIASADASFRRYFRLFDSVNGVTKILMDAPPEKENSEAFIRIAAELAGIGINVPIVYAQNFKQGFFLLSDLGSQDYLSELDDSNAQQLYTDAIDSLLDMQCKSFFHLPAYDTKLLHQELSLFADWFLVKHMQIVVSAQQQAMLDTVFQVLINSATAQPSVAVHRDYHSRNLMVTDKNNPGILDFQDAVLGPVTYDLVSLLRDCYVTWPVQSVSNWSRYYFDSANNKGILKDVSYSQFERWFDLMGLQRHLKAIGIFARLNYRDGKSGYLKDIPRTLAYVVAVSKKYPEFKAFNQFVLGVKVGIKAGIES